MKYINHNIRGASAGGGVIGTKKMYGVNGGNLSRESDPCRADIALNLMPKSAGTVTKRRGFTKKSLPFETDAAISAAAVYDAYLVRYTLYLAGTNLFSVKGDEVKSHALPFDTTDMRPVRMGDYQFFIGGGNLIIYYPPIDRIMYWSDKGCGGDISSTYIPTIYIANTPDGAGASYEGVNLLNTRV